MLKTRIESKERAQNGIFKSLLCPEVTSNQISASSSSRLQHEMNIETSLLTTSQDSLRISKEIVNLRFNFLTGYLRFNVYCTSILERKIHIQISLNNCLTSMSGIEKAYVLAGLGSIDSGAKCSVPESL